MLLSILKQNMKTKNKNFNQNLGTQHPQKNVEETLQLKKKTTKETKKTVVNPKLVDGQLHLSSVRYQTFMIQNRK